MAKRALLSLPIREWRVATSRCLDSSESCCHRLEISLATFRTCVVGSSARICKASSRAYLRQDKLEPLCCNSPFPLAQENSAREARHYCNITIRECLICDVQRWMVPVRYPLVISSPINCHKPRNCCRLRPRYRDRGCRPLTSLVSHPLE
jgi:hypothetical protein